ncbi:MAG TPA: sigma 54-interacting transcriptional regulator [Pyrinomonadaceae bacterium]
MRVRTVCKALTSSREDRLHNASAATSSSQAMVAAELFDHEPGAFTGAIAQARRTGTADGGTLFLDEKGNQHR